MALLRHPDGELRERALTIFLETYAQHALVLTSIFNNLLLDHKIECEQRQYDDVTLPTHLSNEIAPPTVEAMMQAVERHYPLVQEYFRLKAELLGVQRLKNTDLYAPIETEAEEISFAEARDLILTAFGNFNEQFAALAEEFSRTSGLMPKSGRGNAAALFVPPCHLPTTRMCCAAIPAPDAPSRRWPMSWATVFMTFWRDVRNSCTTTLPWCLRRQPRSSRKSF